METNSLKKDDNKTGLEQERDNHLGRDLCCHSRAQGFVVCFGCQVCIICLLQCVYLVKNKAFERCSKNGELMVDSKDGTECFMFDTASKMSFCHRTWSQGIEQRTVRGTVLRALHILV